MDREFNEARQRFIESWGEMASNWGINRTMARIHALLMVSEKPLSMEDIMKELAISRGNVNMNIRMLVDWGLARKVTVKGERREFFQSEQDTWQMCCRIARQRKRRELEPLLATLDHCLKTAGTGKDSTLFRDRLSQLLELVKTLDFALAKVAEQEKNAIIPRLLKLLA